MAPKLSALVKPVRPKMCERVVAGLTGSIVIKLRGSLGCVLERVNGGVPLGVRIRCRGGARGVDLEPVDVVEERVDLGAEGHRNLQKWA